MKKQHLLTLLCLLFCLYSCSDDEKSKIDLKERTIIVDAKTEIGFDEVHNMERSYLRIKFDDNDTKWTTIYGITGFEHEEGYTYILKVTEKTIKNPLPDQPQTTYELIEVISKIGEKENVE